MTFKRRRPKLQGVDSPEALFRDLRNRSVQGLLSHQADILRNYKSKYYDDPNVAIELPTGSGKTLVGLLIAEYRRRVKEERVIYLCPTRQLVRQVADQAERKYGIKVAGFTGKSEQYDPAAKSAYMSAEIIAITTYSALFNVKPFFNNPQLIILDDAHASENYIGSTWSMDINRLDFENLYRNVIDILSDAFTTSKYDRLKSHSYNYDDLGYIEKIPTPIFYENLDELCALFDTNTWNTKLGYSWSFLKDHLHACHVYVTFDSILIRPFIPPTLTHDSFSHANQRVFMSATLGLGGDLERITGIKNISRIEIPEGWDKQGIGRRFFILPELGMPKEHIPKLCIDLIKIAKRALVLVPSERLADQYRILISKIPCQIINASDIENSVDSFTKKNNAVCILANRYDGIDLAGEDCRLLIIDGLPKATNLQERFMMTKMASSLLLNDRIRTRIVQAIGRCTRSATDYAAIIILGEDFHDWLVFKDRQVLFHPELQGELKFGIDQSKSAEPDDYLENLNIFLEHGDKWQEVDEDILGYRDESNKCKLEEEDKLFDASRFEVEFQYALWHKDYEKALELAQQVVEKYTGGEKTRGLRAIWYYFAGTSAYMAYIEYGGDHYKKKYESLFTRAAACVPTVTWLRRLANISEIEIDDNTQIDEELNANIENIDLYFEKNNYSSPAKFESDVLKILNGVQQVDYKIFEEAHKNLGLLLGFESENPKGDAEPDPYWVSNNKLCFVFEDKSEAKEDTPIGVKYTIQTVAQNTQWIKSKLELADDAIIVPVILTYQKKINKEAKIHAKDARYWYIPDFIEWVKDVVAIFRKIRSKYPGSGDLAWRAQALELLTASELSPNQIYEKLNRKLLKDIEVSN